VAQQSWWLISAGIGRPVEQKGTPMATNLRVIPNRPALRVPGYLSVRAAAERLGIRERSVHELIERRRLRSTRLGRLHFLPSSAVESYHGERRRRARQRRQAPPRRAARAAA